MSQTFSHKGRRVDFDLWMFPELAHSIDADTDFDILASMVTGTNATVNYAFRDVAVPTSVGLGLENFDLTESHSSFQWAVGAALAVWGTAMLVPGPVDLAVAMAGLHFGGPVGAVVAVVVYNVFALVVLATGLILMYTA